LPPLLVTVAVKVTEFPYVDVGDDEVVIVPVGAIMVCERADDVELT
jgi:hypothetical protein